MSKSSKKGIVPRLRFPEFKNAGEWEETTLGAVFNYENGKAHEQDIAEKGKFVVANSKFISTDGEVKKFTNSPACIANKNDILMVLSDVPNGRAIAKCFYVEDDDAITVNQRICKLTAKSGFSKFLFYVINRNPYFLKFDDGVKQTNLGKDDVLDCPINCPEKNEQKKIADCLSSLDDVITAQGEKVEALKNYKKGLLQQLFPQDGQTTPSLRFPEFKNAGDWEESVFGDAFERITTKNSENNQNVLTISAQKGLVNQLDYFNKKISARDVSGYYLLHKGDFAYNKSYSQGFPMGAIKLLRDYDKGVVSTLYICFRTKPNFNKHFFEQYFEAGLLNNEIEKIAQEGARNHGLLNVSVTEFFERINLKIPKEDEQKKISECLNSADNIINSEKEILENLKLHKKGLLQQLFPIIESKVE